MSITITSLVDNGDGTATVDWTGGDGGTITVHLFSPPNLADTVVFTTTDPSVTTYTFAAPPGQNFVYVGDLGGLLNFHQTPVTALWMAYPGASLHEYIEADLANGSLGAPEWQEPLIQNRGGDPSNAITWPTCVIDRRREPGTNEVDGDGVTPDSAKGRRVRRTYLVDMPNTAACGFKDTFTIDGATWSFVRVIGRDQSNQGTQTICVVKVDKDFTRQTQLRPTGNWRQRSKEE